MHLNVLDVKRCLFFSNRTLLPCSSLLRQRAIKCRRRMQVCRSKQRVTEEDLKWQDERFRKVVVERVEEAAKLLDDIIDDIVREITVIQSMSYIYEERPSETQAQVVEKIVKRYLNVMDQNFLASLEEFWKNSDEMGHPEVADLIRKIRKEVMKQTQKLFPEEVTLLEDLMLLPEKSDRIAKIQQAAKTQETDPKDAKPEPTEEEPEHGPYMEFSDDIPVSDEELKAELVRLKILKDGSGLKNFIEDLKKEQKDGVVVVEPETISDIDEVMESVENPLEDCEPEKETECQYGKRIDPVQLGMAANQFINDIEEKEEIPNRQLLAKLCVIREEARLVELEMRFSGVPMEENPLKLRENVPSQVIGVIQELLKTADSIKRVGLLRRIFENDEYGPSKKDLSMAPGYVRPGILMTALTMTQMEADERSKHKGSSDKISRNFLNRIEEIRLEAMLVLREIGWGRFSVEELAQKQKEREERERIEAQKSSE